MPTDPATVAFKSDASVRILAHSVVTMIGTSNPSTFEATYVKLPKAAGSKPWQTDQVAGVTAMDFLDPNQLIAQGTDPTTINLVAWAAPYATSGVGLAVSCVVKGITFVYVSGVVAAGDTLFPADAYGRVNNAANLGIKAGDGITYPVGIAQKPSSAANQIIEVLCEFGSVIY